MTTERLSDETRAMNFDETQLDENANTFLDTDEANEKDSTVIEEKISKPAKKKVDSNNIAAAGVGAVAGAAAGAAIGANAATTDDKDIDLKDDEDSKDDEDLSKDIAPENADTDTDSANADADPVDVSDAIEHTDAAPQAINVEVNINGGQYEVHGPNPAEAAAASPADTVRTGARHIHETYKADEPATVEEPAIIEEPAAVEQPLTVDDQIIPQANVSDSMSFSEAFAAARAEVGPGGCFTWHGQVYGTYYENEWNAMSSSQQHDFQMAAMETGRNNPGETYHQMASAKNVEPVAEPNDDVTFVDSEPVTDDEIRVLGMTEIVDETGMSHEAAILDFNGQSAMIVDSDNDMVYDVIISDLDNNNEISANEIMPGFDQAGVSVDDVHSHYMQQSAIEQQFEQDNLGDFDNDVNVDSFV